MRGAFAHFGGGMRRVVIARPDVSVSLVVYVMAVVGAISVGAAMVWWLASRGSICRVLPLAALGVALMAPLTWALRHRIPGSRRATAVFITAAVCWGAVAVWCRLGR